MICKYCNRQIPDGTLCSCPQAQQEAMSYGQYQQYPQQGFPQGQNMQYGQPPMNGGYQQGMNMQYGQPQNMPYDQQQFFQQDMQQNAPRAGMIRDDSAGPYLNDGRGSKRVLRKDRVIMCVLIGVFVLVLIGGIIGIIILTGKKDKKPKETEVQAFEMTDEIQDQCQSVAMEYINALRDNDGMKLMNYSMPKSFIDTFSADELNEAAFDNAQGCERYKESLAENVGQVEGIYLQAEKTMEETDSTIVDEIKAYYRNKGVSVKAVLAVDASLTIKGSDKTDSNKGKVYVAQLDSDEVVVYPEIGLGSEYRNFY